MSRRFRKYKRIKKNPPDCNNDSINLDFRTALSIHNISELLTRLYSDVLRCELYVYQVMLVQREHSPTTEDCDILDL